MVTVKSTKIIIPGIKLALQLPQACTQKEDTWEFSLNIQFTYYIQFNVYRYMLLNTGLHTCLCNALHTIYAVGHTWKLSQKRQIYWCLSSSSRNSAAWGSQSVFMQAVDQEGSSLKKFWDKCGCRRLNMPKLIKLVLKLSVCRKTGNKFEDWPYIYYSHFVNQAPCDDWKRLDKHYPYMIRVVL